MYTQVQRVCISPYRVTYVKYCCMKMMNLRHSVKTPVVLLVGCYGSSNQIYTEMRRTSEMGVLHEEDDNEYDTMYAKCPQCRRRTSDKMIKDLFKVIQGCDPFNQTCAICLVRKTYLDFKLLTCKHLVCASCIPHIMD